MKGCFVFLMICFHIFFPPYYYYYYASLAHAVYVHYLIKLWKKIILFYSRYHIPYICKSQRDAWPSLFISSNKYHWGKWCWRLKLQYFYSLNSHIIFLIAQNCNIIGLASTFWNKVKRITCSQPRVYGSSLKFWWLQFIRECMKINKKNS